MEQSGELEELEGSKESKELEESEELNQPEEVRGVGEVGGDGEVREISPLQSHVIQIMLISRYRPPSM